MTAEPMTAHVTRVTPSMLSPNRAQRRALGHARRGQTIVVALLVLLLLGLVGAVFVTIVARNLVNARHANRVVTADYYARAGITFTDAQLTYSPDGADWRPPLQFTVANAPTEAREAARYAAAVTANSLSAAAVNDPDKAYLDAGFTRYNTGAGRFLLRVTYDPINLNTASIPPGRYLKIESIGREGVVDAADPTTYSNNRSTDRTQAVLVAYKPIGITDYARFETNPDKRSDIANLGVVSQVYTNDPDTGNKNTSTDPALGILTQGVYDFVNAGSADYQLYPVTTTYGAPDAYLVSGTSLIPNPSAGTATDIDTTKAFPGGGSIHSNMPLRFFGKNVVYLNDASLSGQSAPAFQDVLEINGNLLLDGYNPTIKLDNTNASNTGTSTAPVYVGQSAALSLNPKTLTKPITSAVTPTPYSYQSGLVSPSNAVTGQATDANLGFSTFNSLIRDGSMQNDIDGQPRGISRLEPPQMDGTDPASSLPRYKALAMNSPVRLDPSTGLPYTGTDPAKISGFGYGQSIYVNNPDDIQQESQSIGGGNTLTQEWLNRTNVSGVDTVGGWNGELYDPVGVDITLGLQTANVKASASAPPEPFAGITLTRSDKTSSLWTDPSGNALNGTANDGATSSTMPIAFSSLYASNDLNADPATLTGAALTAYQKNPNNDILIYAEGNVRVHGILSPPETVSGTTKTIPRHITIVTDGTAYIDGSLLKGDPDSSITVLAHNYVCVNTTQFLAGSRSATNQYNPQAVSDQTVSGKTEGTSFFAFGSASPPLLQDLNFGLPNPANNVGATYPSLALYVSGEPEPGTTSASADFNILSATGASLYSNMGVTFTQLSHQVYPLGASLNGLTQSDVSQFNVNMNPGSVGNFWLQRAAVLPMDVRIEAVLFAQTRSFFVIPGDWFNEDASDTINSYAATGSRSASSQDERFPFYGQPIDLKITIDGALSEARPADIASQTAWMLKWGWIPQYHGNPIGLNGGGPENAGHPGRIGLQIIYNPQAGYPYSSWGLDSQSAITPALPAERPVWASAPVRAEAAGLGRAAVCRPERRHADLAISVCSRILQ